MADYTDHYGLSKLQGRGDSFTEDGYKYTYADRDRIDTGIYLGAEAHRHIGGVGVLDEPTQGPDLELFTTGGTIPAGTRVYYKYTLVSERGEESAGSEESFVDTPAPIAEPASPGISYLSTGGFLQGGNYYYVLTSYVGASIAESLAESQAFITIPATTATNAITLDLPDPADGQTGFNVYRRKPGQAKFFFLESVVTDVVTPPTTYEDTGATEDCDRTLPKVNTTNSTNSILVSIPGATPAVPEGYTWRIYRTYIDGDWESSFLVWVVENIEEASTIITPEYLDIGISTQSGSPPTTTYAFGNPDPIDLETETDGSLPMGRVNAFPVVVELSFPGIQSVGPGEGQWPCPFEQALFISAIPALGRGGSAPVADDLITDIQIGRGSSPVYTSVYLVDADRPTVLQGQNKASAAFPATATLGNRLLVQGDVLSGENLQVGGSATPQDEDLTVTCLLYVQVDELENIDWS